MVVPCVARPIAGNSTLCSSGTPLDGHLGCKPQSCNLSLHSRNRFGARTGFSSLSQHASAVRRPVLRRSRPLRDGNEFQMLNVEDDEVAVEGVIRVDKQQSAEPSLRRACVLAGGDVLVLLAFASVGRLSHGLSTFDWEVVRTADPFIAGWVLAAYFLGSFGPEGQGLNGLRAATISTVKSWAVGIPLGLVIRSVSSGHAPPLPFVLVSLGSTFAVLVTWRALFTAIFPNVDLSKQENARKGNFLELFELLASLVRRW